MSDPIRNVPGTQPPPAPEHGSGAKPALGTDSTEFRRILEQLESVSRHATPPAAADGNGAIEDEGPVEDSPEDLARDLAKAEEEFDSVMDMRRRLEDAFRRLDS